MICFFSFWKCGILNLRIRSRNLLELLIPDPYKINSDPHPWPSVQDLDLLYLFQNPTWWQLYARNWLNCIFLFIFWFQWSVHSLHVLCLVSYLDIVPNIVLLYSYVGVLQEPLPFCRIWSCLSICIPCGSSPRRSPSPTPAVRYKRTCSKCHFQIEAHSEATILSTCTLLTIAKQF
jgi:hypothetical protein